MGMEKGAERVNKRSAIRGQGEFYERIEQDKAEEIVKEKFGPCSISPINEHVSHYFDVKQNHVATYESHEGMLFAAKVAD